MTYCTICHTLYDMSKIKRVNARITAGAERKLKEIVRDTGSSMSEVIMAAIERYWAESQSYSNSSPSTILKNNQFIGCANGNQKLSENYKRVLQTMLNQKYDNH